jgi:U32 family peptidase
VGVFSGQTVFLAAVLPADWNSIQCVQRLAKKMLIKFERWRTLRDHYLYDTAWEFKVKQLHPLWIYPIEMHLFMEPLSSGVLWHRMNPSQRQVELLAPAGNFEKLETAIHFGADAVYLSGKNFSLRNFSGNFSLDEIEAAITLGHARDVRIYIACNIYSRNHEQQNLRKYLTQLGKIGPDGIIVADPAIFMAARELMPKVPIHISTQTNTTNFATAQFWQNLGAERIIAARELSLLEIQEIATKGQLAVEAFVHGAMCISYSGRCLLSNFLANRDSNRGRCAQPCRWNYAVVEEKRPGQYLPVTEDERGSYIFNARDLCMIEHIPALIESGLTALKIEGRMKGIHYVAATVKAYRDAIDAYYRHPGAYSVRQDWVDTLDSVNQRGYCTGFYFGDPVQTQPNLELTRPAYEHRLVGKVISVSTAGTVVVDVRNRLATGETIEFLSPGRPVQHDKVSRMVDLSNKSVAVAHAGMQVAMDLKATCQPNDLIRRRDPSIASPPHR